MTPWITVGRVTDIPRLGARVIRTAKGAIAVFRTADDRIFALDDRCPHKGGPLSQGIVHGERVTCPLHNWMIELCDGRAVAPDDGCAASHPVRVEDGVISLCLEAKASRAA
jgi:nitrite reductase [NAD(P)H] small subunit